MRCPFCDNDESKVLESRSADEGSSIRRRRECINCSKRFTTYERLEERPFLVIKSDGKRETFDMNKILRGIVRAMEKRPVSIDDINQAVLEIETQAKAAYEKEIPSAAIGELVMDKLKQMDEVAYVRFASVYRQFKDVQDFMKELNNFLQQK